MGKSFREMTHQRCRDMEDVGCNERDRADETVRGGRDESPNYNGDRVSGGSAGGGSGWKSRGETEDGPGFPSPDWGED